MRHYGERILEFHFQRGIDFVVLFVNTTASSPVLQAVRAWCYSSCLHRSNRNGQKWRRDRFARWKGGGGGCWHKFAAWSFHVWVSGRSESSPGFLTMAVPGEENTDDNIKQPLEASEAGDSYQFHPEAPSDQTHLFSRLLRLLAAATTSNFLFFSPRFHFYSLIDIEPCQCLSLWHSAMATRSHQSSCGEVQDQKHQQTGREGMS